MAAVRRPSGIAITADDTIYVADSESWGTDTGARELPGIKKGIRIGSARDGRVTAFIEDQESTAPITPAPRASASTRRETSTAASFAAGCSNDTSGSDLPVATFVRGLRHAPAPRHDFHDADLERMH